MRDNRIRVYEDKRYAYDGHGRLAEKRIAKHTVQRFEWDDEDRLTRVSTTRRPGTKHETTQTTRFEYDALGRRVAKVDTFGRTEFIWEGMRLIEERRGSHAIAYVYEPGSYVPLARIDAADAVQKAEAANEATPSRADETAAGDEPPSGAQLYYFHTDPSGLPEELSDGQGRLRWRAHYRAWGNTLQEQWEATDLDGRPMALDATEQTDALEQNLRFQGQYLDRDTGLHYNTFRYYDPDVGRFISPDPIGLSGGGNLFAYAPSALRWIDPLGLSGDDLIRYKPRPTIAPQPGSRGTAINRAWGQERDLVKAGGGTRAWTPEEIAIIKNTTSNGELASIMSERGYTGHHINSVKGNGALGTNWQGDPRNIVFLQNGNYPSGNDEHLRSNQGHRGNYDNNGRGRLIDREAMTRARRKGGC